VQSNLLATDVLRLLTQVSARSTNKSAEAKLPTRIVRTKAADASKPVASSALVRARGLPTCQPAGSARIAC